MALSRITANSIQDGTVIAADLADGSVTSAKIQSDVVLQGNVTLGAVTFPDTDGTSGQVLSTNGSGTSNWTDSYTDEIGTLKQYYKSDFVTPDATFPDSTWLKADGSVVSQATYTDLFARVGLQPDGLDNFESVFPSLTLPNKYHYGENLYLAAGDSGALATSTDSITWTSRTSGITASIYALTSGNSLYVYGAAGGLLRTSTDGITWTARTSGSATTAYIGALTFGDNLYVYADSIGAIRSSTNGITWTARTSGTTFNIEALAYGNGLFVYGDYNGNIRTSTDAITWDVRTSGLNTGLRITDLVYGDGIFVAASDAAASILTSTDGITWTKNLTGFFPYRLAYDDGIYLASDGFFGSVLHTSTDAINWTMRKGYNRYVVGAGGGRYLVNGSTVGGIKSAPKYTYNTATEFALPLAGLVPNVWGTTPTDNQLATYIKATT